MKATKIYESNGHEYYARWDNKVKIYEIFKEPECEAYVGCADTISEAKSVAKWDVEDIGCW